MPLSIDAKKTVKIQVNRHKNSWISNTASDIGVGSLQTALSSEQTGLQIPFFRRQVMVKMG
jgi:hypothetical protein